jgi:hypothetical protein
MGMSTQLLFTTIITLMKVAILITYLRKPQNLHYGCLIAHIRIGIFPSKTNKWFCHIMIFYTLTLNISCFFLTLFQCR